MQEYSRENFSAAQSLSALFDWDPDIERFEREVAEAEAKGSGDGLSLAEMECSLDLIDAELLTYRGQERADAETIEKLRRLRGQLVRLIERMRPYAQY